MALLQRVAARALLRRQQATQTAALTLARVVAAPAATGADQPNQRARSASRVTSAWAAVAVAAVAAGVAAASTATTGASWPKTAECAAEAAPPPFPPPSAGSTGGRATADAGTATATATAPSTFALWREAYVGAYENRLRAFSHPLKVFKYFASVHRSDGVYMRPHDFVRSLVPFVPGSETGNAEATDRIVRQRLNLKCKGAVDLFRMRHTACRGPMLGAAHAPFRGGSRGGAAEIGRRLGGHGRRRLDLVR